jgi:hypothetical protein
MLSDSEEVKKELARVADDIYSNTKEESGKDTGASQILGAGIRI